MRHLHTPAHSRAPISSKLATFALYANPGKFMIPALTKFSEEFMAEAEQKYQMPVAATNDAPAEITPKLAQTKKLSDAMYANITLTLHQYYMEWSNR